MPTPQGHEYQTVGAGERRTYRFVGGPWHNEFHQTDGHGEWFVPVRLGIKTAVYVRQGNNEAVWFYRFAGVNVR